MTEDFLQYIWRYNLFIDNYKIGKSDLSIINVGQLNTDSGPDFFNAKIQIDDTVWAGNVEIHQKSSDWFLHNHHKDKAYNNVILHVVYEIDKDVFDSNGRKIPQIKLKFDKSIYLNYNNILNSKHKIKCEPHIQKLNYFDIKMWLDKLTVERLERKSNEIIRFLDSTINDWNEVFYITLLRYFGLKVNSEPFEILARSLPYKILLKNINNITVLESLLFGQAGFLNDEINDKYFKVLKKEYAFYKTKYDLKPSLQKENWKFMRIRPASFPTLRIAQFASLISSQENIFSKILNFSTYKEFYKLFNVDVSEYWKSHYNFAKESKTKPKNLGKQTIDLIIINVIVPLLFTYGHERKLEEYKEKAVGLLSELKPEKNSIIKYWNKIGVETENSFETQALLELYSNYCQTNNCLRCSFANKFILK